MVPSYHLVTYGKKNDAIMTDAVTVEALDQSNLDVLTKIE